jgi:hypothetical protein
MPSELDSRELFLIRRDDLLELARPRDKSPRSMICCVSRATFITRIDAADILLVLDQVGFDTP